MESHLNIRAIFTFLSLITLVLVGSLQDASCLSPAEAYWKMALPNTPMPKAVKNRLPTAAEDGRVGVGHGGNISGTGTMKVPYWYNAAAAELLYLPNETVVFLEKDMKQGTEMNLDLSESAAAATFLPRQVAQSIPFSSNKYVEILNRFSVKPDSVEAKIIKETIKECEDIGLKGEPKYCATSLESMIDYCTSLIGKNHVRAISTELTKKTQLQKYRITGLIKIKSIDHVGGDGGGVVVCHMQNYVYAVFYCHKLPSTIAYMVTLEGADGTKAKAVAVCHTDTSKWNPKHLVFQILKVKPGVSLCHIMYEDNIVWVTSM